MHLIDVLLPLFDNEGQRFPQPAYGQVRAELTDKFGGLTAFTRVPAEGLWTEGGTVRGDEIVIFQVMVEHPDEIWWRSYREASSVASGRMLS